MVKRVGNRKAMIICRAPNVEALVWVGIAYPRCRNPVAS